MLSCLLRPVVLLLVAGYIPLVAAEEVSGSALVGVVEDGNVEPLHASVTAFQVGVTNGILTPRPQCVTETNSAGQFSCQSLMAGSYLLLVRPLNSALPPTKRPLRPNVAKKYPSFILYPTIYDGQMSELLDLRKGNTLSVQITVNDQWVYPIRVESPSGGEGRRLQLFWKAGDFVIPVFNAKVAGGRLDADYTFDAVPAGSYLLVNSWVDRGRKYDALGYLTVNEYSQDSVTLKEEKSYDISGSVKIAAEDGLSPSEGGSKSLLRIGLTSVTNDVRHRYATSLDANGSFRFEGVVAGEYKVSLDGASGLYVTDVFIGQRREDNSILGVNEGSADLPLTLAAAPTAASISGSMELNGTELKPGILIHSTDSNVNKVVSVNKRGLFFVGGLPPGDYLLYGWDNVDSVPYASQGFLARYISNALSMELGTGSHVTGIDIECNNVHF